MKKDQGVERMLASKIMNTCHRRDAALAAYERLQPGLRALLLGRLGVAIGRAS